MASLPHSLPPGVQGDRRGSLSLAVDEVVWLHGSGRAAVLAEWWGSHRQQQVVFSNVDTGLAKYSGRLRSGGRAEFRWRRRGRRWQCGAAAQLPRQDQQGEDRAVPQGRQPSAAQVAT